MFWKSLYRDPARISEKQLPGVLKVSLPRLRSHFRETATGCSESRFTETPLAFQRNSYRVFWKSLYRDSARISEKQLPGVLKVALPRLRSHFRETATGCSESRFTKTLLAFQRNSALFSASHKQKVAVRGYTYCSNCVPPCLLDVTHLVSTDSRNSAAN